MIAINNFFKRNLYFKRDIEFTSIASEKRAILTSQIALLCLLLSVFFTGIDVITGYTESFQLYILLTLLGGSTYSLNRIGKHSLAKIILMVGVNIIIFMAYEAEGFVTGAYAFFIASIVSSFSIFGYEKRGIAVLLSILSVVLFYLSTSFDFDWIEKANFNPENETMYFIFNFIIALISSILMILFLIQLNHISESELLKASEELKANKLRFDLAIKGSSVGIWDWDVLNDRLFLSPLLIKLLNFPSEKYENMSSEKLNRVVHPDDQQKVRMALEGHLSSQEPYLLECRLRKGDNTYFWVLVSGQAEWNEFGEATRMVGTIVDINDLKRAFSMLEEKNLLLEKTNEELDRFVYSTSHDLKAPLSSILGLVKIAERTDDFNEVHKCLVMIENRVNTLNGFIAEIIDYSRNTRLEVINEEIELKKLIEELIQGLSYYEQSNQLDFIINIPEEVKIESDKSRLKIILNNLIANAIKYHQIKKDNKAYVSISYHIMPLYAEIEIKDNGLGISEEFQEKIFDMFFRASEKSEGSGLGLYIAKEMALKLGGELTLSSRLHEGSTFTVKLPHS